MSTVIPSKSPLTKQERDRKIKAIYREMEAKRRELGLRAPMIKRGPVFYFIVLATLLLVGGLVVQTATKGGEKKMRDGNLVKAEKSVSALAEAQVRVPEDVSVVGIHDPWFAPYLAPALTTVALPLFELGRQSVLQLMEHLQSGKPSETVITDPAPRLVVRG